MRARETGTVAPAGGHRGRLLRFGLVGCLNTAVDLATFILLLEVAGLHLLLANTAGVLAGATNSYLLNKLWTFRDPSRGRANLERYLRFLAFNGVGLVIANVTIALLVVLMPPVPAKLGSIAVTMIWNYWTSHRYVYRPA
jgi:putative flippase GtrA